jgi:membrane associated rhomboid family serine protease
MCIRVRDIPYGRPVRVGSWTFHFSSLHLLMWAIGLGFVGQVALSAGELGMGGGFLNLGSVGGGASWATGSVGPNSVFHNLEWWRLFASVFLHGSVVHLLVNSLALYNLGRLVDRLYGPTRLLLVFLATGLIASLASAAWKEVQGVAIPSVGASGAICGFLGLLLANMRRRSDAAGQMVGRQLLQWSIIMLVFGLVIPQVDNAAHVGGFAAGYLLSFVLREGHFDHLHRGPEAKVALASTWVLAIATVIALGIAGVGATGRLDRLEGLEVIASNLSDLSLSRRDGEQLILHRSAIRDVESNDEVVLDLRRRALEAIDATGQDRTQRLTSLADEAAVRLIALAPDVFQFWELP